MIRRAAVAGTFYPGTRPALESLLGQCIPRSSRRREAKAIIVPHAGYAYSGSVAGWTYASVRLPQRFVLLCPNHTGLGAPISIMSEGCWETPLGTVDIDTELATLICQESPQVQESPLAHRNEHALEVHLPFLQYSLDSPFTFVPISIGTKRYDSLVDLGRALARAVEMSPQPVLLVASSDMNHFESAERTEIKDRMAIEKILALDPRGLHRVVEEQHISMCGCGPSVAVLEAARLLGARDAELIQYTHSGEITGDRSSVVGYAGLAIH